MRAWVSCPDCRQEMQLLDELKPAFQEVENVHTSADLYKKKQKLRKVDES